MKALDRALSALVVAALAVGPSHVVALTTNTGFNFTVNLTATCLFSTVNSFTIPYTSFAAAPTVSNAGFTVQCTNLLPYALSLTGGTESSGAYTATGTNTGIAHTITVNIDNSGALTPLPSATGRTGNGAAQTYALTTTVDVSNASCAAPTAGICSDTTAHTIVATF
jgi:spore coat protein U-like protein